MKNINEIASDWQKQGHKKSEEVSTTAVMQTSPKNLTKKATSTSLSTPVSGEFNHELKDVLRPYTVEQRKHIMAFFGKMQENFSTQFTHMYGSEPDDEFAAFASQLSVEDVERIVHHLRERLLAGKEWPPALALLSMLKDLPLNTEILEARHRILIKKQPITRVEKYIFNRKASYLRGLSEKNLAEEFKLLYINAYQEVLHNLDLTLDKREKHVEQNILNVELTETDLEIQRRMTQGLKPTGNVGHILSRIDKLRHGEASQAEQSWNTGQDNTQPTHAINKDKIDREQQALMEQILRETNGGNENI
ncbi:hypothetical protein GCM10007938_12640 [Vibrio zhanjiangensis]|uniref:Uncharacterized protein n=1 Tax=Vibrio zhanjiangensis TaxID=1046128 RepID=A0ABQ6EYA8_9VIBR|nr:hypothetical protein [Vibrio zhanjiangensis]GLT17487.1 hypothetical protein GCM10007938_12640 [Vibrio zhanjiangensis]